jgi:hypothetical protein
MPFEQFDLPPKGKKGIVASLDGCRKDAKLRIGRLLVEKGFDLTLTYDLLFDAETRTIGLRPAANGSGRKVYDCSNLRYVYLGTFCRHYGLDGRRYIVRECRLDNNIWQLPLSEK